MSCKVLWLSRIDKYLKMLSDIEDALTEVAITPFDKPLASKEVIEAFKKVEEISLKYYERRSDFFVSITHDSLFYMIHDAILDLGHFVYHANMLCKYGGPVVGFNPCKVYTLDLDLKFLVANFRRFADQAKTRYRDAEYDVRQIEYHGESLLNNLKRISWYCMRVIGANCLKHATPEEAKPASLRTYVVDLISAIRLIARRFSESYRGVTEQKVGYTWFYKHPKATEELLYLAAYTILMLHKQFEIAEKHIVSDVSWLRRSFRAWAIKRYTTLVYALKDRVEITLDYDADIVVKPRWVVEVDPTIYAKNEIEVLKQVLSERGYKVETTDYGFKITIPPGDIMEVIKIIATLIPLRSIEFASKDEARKFVVDIVERLRPSPHASEA
jgi:hypothetical protein